MPFMVSTLFAALVGWFIGREIPAVADELLRRAYSRINEVVLHEGWSPVEIASRREYSACSSIGAACGVVFVGSHIDALRAFLLSICAFAMAVAVLCDVRARLIPFETCGVLAFAGSILQIQIGGFAGLTVGAVCAGVIMAGCGIANRMLRRSGEAVGWGDVRCMGALSLASGELAPLGFALSYGLAALYGLCGLAARTLSWSDGMPMAPFFVAWFMCVVVLAL